MNRRLLVWSALLWLGWVARAPGWNPTGLDALDLRHLPRLRTGTSHLASSADPRGGNDDRGHFQRRDGLDAVLLETTGPGLITRIWSANPHGTLRLYFDGEAAPRVSLPFEQLADETPETPTVAGYVSRAGGGVSCWYPLPFARGCRVVVEGAEQLYYQVNYTRLPAGTAVTSFRPGPAPVLRGGSWGTESDRRVTAPPGGRATLLEATGPATIRRLLLEVTPASYDALRRLRLTMRWDGGPASVDAPLLDLFAAGLGPAQYLSAPVSVAAWNLFQLDLPLPFARSARLELSNTGPRPVTVRATSYLEAGRRPDDGYLHAFAAASRTVGGQPHRLVAVNGRGQYVGAAVTLLGNASLDYLEGDETVIADGQRLQGTGTEDWFNGAWFFRNGPFADLLAGAPLLWCGKASIAAYRWQIADAVPFQRRLEVNLEHGPHNSAPGCTYRTVAFFYAAQPQAAPSPPTVGPVPQCEAETGATVVEAETLAAQAQVAGGQATAVADSDTPLPAVGGRLLRLAYARGQTAPRAELPLQVPRAGFYDLVLRLVAGSPNQAVAGTLDGRPLPAPPAAGGPGDALLVLGRARILAGPHRLGLAITPAAPGAGGYLGIDQIHLREVGRVRGALEAEDLAPQSPGAPVQEWDGSLVGAVRAPDVTGGGVSPEAVWSGGAQLLLDPAKGGEVELPFQVDQGGLVGLALGFTRGPDAGALAVALDGRSIAAAGLAAQAATVQVGARVPLGVWELRAGRHSLRVRAQDRPVGVDYLLVTPCSRGHEAELLLRTNDLAAAGVVKERFGAEPRWSGGGYVRFQAPPEGQAVKLGLIAPRTGRYQVTIKEARVPTGGQWDLLVGGQTVAVDSRGAGEALGRGATLTTDLRRGANALSLRLTQPGAGGGDLALDVIELERRGPSTAQWVGWTAGGLLVALLLGWWRRRRGPS